MRTVDENEDRTSAYKWIAILLASVGAVALVGAWLFFSHYNGYQFATESKTWGEFGDFIGGFVSTIIALASLIALAITVYLQSVALRDTRRALKNQLAAFNASESTKIRPLIKTGWSDIEHIVQGDIFRIVWSIRNVGLGPAILDLSEFIIFNKTAGEQPLILGADWVTEWGCAIRQALGDDAWGEIASTTYLPFNDQTRIMPTGDSVNFVTIEFFDRADAEQGRSQLAHWLDVVIHFRSMANERFTTRTQLLGLQS